MKRKSPLISIAGSSVLRPAIPEAKTNFESKDQVYNCLNCGELPVSRFSKSKVNQYDRQKITVITCNVCTCKAVTEDENEKSGAKKMRIKKAKADSNDQKEYLLAKKSDPSALYESNPLDAPTINDAVEYFEQRSLVFKIHIGKVKGWRTVAKLAVRGELVKSDEISKSVSTSIGLFQPGTHRVIKCLESDAHHPSINICVKLIAETCAQLGINGYIEGSGSDQAESFLRKTYLKYIIMAVERATNRVQLSLVWNTSPTGNLDGDAHLEKLVSALSDKTLHTIDQRGSNYEDLAGTMPLFHSIWVNYNSSSRYNNAITCHDEDSWCLRFGKSQIKEKVATDMAKPPRLRFPPLVFRQANIDAFTNIVQNIRNWIKKFTIPDFVGHVGSIEESENSSQIDISTDINLEPKINCVELYGGVGTIGLNCLDLFSSLHCSDENPNNKVCFDATLAKMSSSIRARAIYESKGASTIARAGGLKGHDIIIVDPPRKGLDDDVIDAMLAYYPDSKGAYAGYKDRRAGDTEHGRRNSSRMIYVSCGFKAFKRDIARLLGETDSAVGVGLENGSATTTDNSENPSYKLKMSTGHDDDISSGSNKQVRYWKLVHAEGHVLFPGSDHIETFAVLDRVF